MTQNQLDCNQKNSVTRAFVWRGQRELSHLLGPPAVTGKYAALRAVSPRFSRGRDTVFYGMDRGGIEPPTPGFSVLCQKHLGPHHETASREDSSLSAKKHQENESWYFFRPEKTVPRHQQVTYFIVF